MGWEMAQWVGVLAVHELELESLTLTTCACNPRTVTEEQRGGLLRLQAYPSLHIQGEPVSVEQDRV